MKEIIKKKRGICIVITIWQGITIQGLYCYLDMGNNTIMYYKCSHVPNLLTCMYNVIVTFSMGVVTTFPSYNGKATRLGDIVCHFAT